MISTYESFKGSTVWVVAVVRRWQESLNPKKAQDEVAILYCSPVYNDWQYERVSDYNTLQKSSGKRSMSQSRPVEGYR